MLEPHTPDRPDDLKQRYLQASAEQAIGPSEKVRRAALAHAQAVAAGAANEVTTRLPQAAANRSRWNTPLVASLAIASISALLALQFDRGESADKQVALGTPPAPTTPLSSVPLNRVPVSSAPVNSAPVNSAPLKSASPSSTPAAERAAPPDAPVAFSSVPRRAPVPSPGSANTTATSGLPPTAAKNTASAREVNPAPAALEAADLAAGSEKNAADQAMSSRPVAPQNKAAPSPDAERVGRASARSESSPSQAPTALQSRPAETAVATPAPVPGPGPVLKAPPLDGAAALREAARTGQAAALAQALLTVNAAQLNSTDSAGRTALMLATLGGHLGSVQRLVNAGADTELRDVSGQTAAQMAKRLGFKQIESILKSS